MALSSLLHRASFALSRRGSRHFKEATFNLQDTQVRRLRSIMALVEGTETAARYSLSTATCPVRFARQVPLSNYEDWQAAIQRQRDGDGQLTSETCERYQPTSGSTSQVKWIPYTPAFLHELDQAIAPWVSDLYQRYPAIRHGRHYWSLSWVPQALRSEAASVNDDLKLLPWWKRLFMAGTMAVPENISLAPTSELSMFASLCYLASSRDLTMISVWSPTFAIGLLDTLAQQREAVSRVLLSGRWPADKPELRYLKAPKQRHNGRILQQWDGAINAATTAALWPQLALISAWDTSSSASWAQQLQQLFAHCEFQGKGLWATEGVVTFPLNGQYPLALESHFYEFENLDNGEILFAWQLQRGMRVRPIITTGNGLLRYVTKDQLLVDGFLNQCPSLRFISRLSGTDMVGEKMSPEAVLNLFDLLSNQFAIKPVSLLAVPGKQTDSKPGYLLLAEGNADAVAAVNEQLEVLLNEHFHYRLARELGQLQSAQTQISSNAMDTYMRLRIASGAVAGNIKVEPLTLCPEAADLLHHSEQREAISA